MFAGSCSKQTNSVDAGSLTHCDFRGANEQFTISLIPVDSGFRRNEVGINVTGNLKSLSFQGIKSCSKPA